MKGENVGREGWVWRVGAEGECGRDEGVQVCVCDTFPLLLLPWLPQVTLAIFMLLWVHNP